MNVPENASTLPKVADELLVPITLALSPVRRLLIIDIKGDPNYRTLEPQVLDGAGGDVLVLLAYRHDGRVELYVPSGHDVDASGYEGLGEGLVGIQHSAFEVARFELAEDGLRLDLALAAPNGRRFGLRLHEHLHGPRDQFPVLAPVGGAFEAPAFFPFIWLPGMSFVPVRGTDVKVRVDGWARDVRRLPLPIGGRRCLMARYDPDALVCQLNPDNVRIPTRVAARTTGESLAPGVDVVEIGGGSGVAAVRVGRGDHTSAVLLDPPLPDLRSVADAFHRQGTISIQADHAIELRGRYEFSRFGDRVDLAIEGFEPWRTRLRRPLLAALFHLPIFRRWPTTYRWHASLDLAATPEELISRWTRCPKRWPSANSQPSLPSQPGHLSLP